mmetsp:Transcript_42418/g.57941  ORF Transcript_42418/g.57941 Transcript_42418/m.57941 type:complete len:200 (-) Transcript_42418:1069-1668(-)
MSPVSPIAAITSLVKYLLSFSRIPTNLHSYSSTPCLSLRECKYSICPYFSPSSAPSSFWYASRANISRSPPSLNRHWKYSTGLFSRCSSTWWNECCATYAIRRLWCFQTDPPAALFDGNVSPTSILMSVDLPAPLGPRMATREPRQTWQLTPVRVAFSLPGYVKSTFSIRAMARVVELIPSRRPGFGNLNWSPPVLASS